MAIPRARVPAAPRRLAWSADPAILKDHLAGPALIAVDFPKFTDGRGYSIGAPLRRRYGWTGELVRRRRGAARPASSISPGPASTPSPAPGRDAEAAARAFEDFSIAYQDASDTHPGVADRMAAAREVAKIVRTRKLLARIAAAQSRRGLRQQPPPPRTWC
ncbi:MAG: DUF934 domain-containing protein [Alphaproteobacteria bacterium]